MRHFYKEIKYQDRADTDVYFLYFVFSLASSSRKKLSFYQQDEIDKVRLIENLLFFLSVKGYLILILFSLKMHRF